MPKLSDLILDLATVLLVEQTTVNTYARHLREAGMLSQAGRGIYAAQATPLDAARIIIAMAVPAHAKNAPQTVRDFGGLVCAEKHEASEKTALKAGKLFQFQPHGTLESMVAGLISIFADNDRYELFAAEGNDRYLPTLNVTIDCAVRSAVVHLGPHKYVFLHSNSDQLLSLMLRAAEPGASEYDRAEYERLVAEDRALHARYFRGIRQTSVVSGVEFQPIGEMLAGLRPPGHRETAEEANERLLATYSAKNADEGNA